MGFRSLSGAGGGAAFNNFVLSVGQSGNTTYVLDEAYPAGAYAISNSGDTTFDIYAIGTDGTRVGYTNGSKLEASADIKEIVILGAAANEVFVFEFSGVVTAPTSKGDVASAGAFVTSIEPSSLPDIDDTVTVTGGNFAADVEAYFIDQSANEVAPKTVVRNSSTEIVVTRPDSFSTADSPFTIKVVNPNVTLPTGSSAHLLSNAVTAGTNPVWQTAAAQTYAIGIANTITLVASDTEASDVDYAITAGSLPSGLTLDGETGVISGTPSGVSEGDQTVFTVRATDTGGNFVDREFTFTALPPISGGTVRTDSTYTYHEFTSNDTLNLATNLQVEYLIVGGGGAGGSYGSDNVGGGGGGAGGVLTGTTTLSSGNYPIIIGAGGAASSSRANGNNGENTTAFSFTAFGGGGGSEYNKAGLDGGSGGGGNNGQAGGSGITGQGNAGGFGNTQYAGGGGGGAGSAGLDASSGVPGNGGAGVTHLGVLVAGGGGGGFSGGQGPSAGGSGIGGNGSGGGTFSATNGQANTGSGGGGAGDQTTSGAGGSGIVVIRYPTP